MNWSLRHALAAGAAMALGGAAAAVTAAMPATGATSASTNQWRIVYQSSVRGTVEGIAAVSPRNAWAVWRTYDAKGAITFQPHVLRWNGSKWSTVSVPAAKGYVMEGVTASSATNVWLFGERQTGPQRVFRWDGAHWHTFGSPVGGAVVLGATSAWSLEGGGCSVVNGKPACTSYLFHWNGTTWASSTLPAGLAGMGGTPSSGVYTVGTTARGYLLAYHWAGSRWTLVTMPHPKVAAALGIAATAGNNVWISVNPHGNSMYALHWNGAKWQQTPSISVAQTYIGSSVVPDGHGGVWLGDWHWTGKSWVDTSASILDSYQVVKVPGSSASYWAAAFTPDPAHHAAIAVYGPLP